MSEPDYRLPSGPRRTLRALLPVVVGEQARNDGPTVEDALRGVESFLTAIGPGVRVAIVAGLRAFDAGARAFPKGGVRARARARIGGFAALDAGVRDAYFRSWWESRLPPAAQFARGVKTLLCFAWYELPEVERRIGYRPAEWIERVRSERLKRHATDIAKAEAAILAPDPLPPCLP